MKFEFNPSLYDTTAILIADEGDKHLFPFVSRAFEDLLSIIVGRYAQEIRVSKYTDKLTFVLKHIDYHRLGFSGAMAASAAVKDYRKTVDEVFPRFEEMVRKVDKGLLPVIPFNTVLLPAGELKTRVDMTYFCVNECSDENVAELRNFLEKSLKDKISEYRDGNPVEVVVRKKRFTGDVEDIFDDNFIEGEEKLSYDFYDKSEKFKRFVFDIPASYDIEEVVLSLWLLEGWGV